MRHASGKVMIDLYPHLWPDPDDSTRAAGDKVLATRVAEVPQHLGDFPLGEG